MYSRRYKSVVTLPPLLWVSLFLLIPYAMLFCYSFWGLANGVILHRWSLENYRELYHNPMYAVVFLRSARIAATVTAFCLLLGYPVAYYLSFHTRHRKEILYQLVVLPLWASYLVRGYAWKTILGSDGILNGLLQYLHFTHHPVEFLLYSPFAVILTLTHIYTPIVFLPVYASLEHVPRILVEASEDLGASPVRTFWNIIFPLSLPGV